MKNLSLFTLYLAGWFGLRSAFPKFFASHNFIFWCVTISIFVIHALLAVPDVVSLIDEELHYHMHRFQRLSRGWYCGSGNTNSHLTGLWASVFTSDHALHHVNECCYEHDMQYDQCVDRDAPDAAFRMCLMNACGDDADCDLFVHKFFATIVDYIGFVAFSQECGLSWLFSKQT